jgi:predicted P-loop ATPase
MRNKWIIEISEMECTRRADTQALKSFLSRRTDTVRLAYARTSKDFPRHNIFIGTFNPESVGSYLKDMTGNRRYLPLAVEGVDFLDFKKFKFDVGQLWAEALVRYKESPSTPLYLTDKVVFKQAAHETLKRREVDSWFDSISDWLDNPDGSGVPKTIVSATEIFTHALGKEKGDLGNSQFRRIANVMVKELGWFKTIRKINGKMKRVYVKEEEKLINQL